MLVAFQVLNKILQTKDINFIKSNSLDDTYFTGFTDEFHFIVDHYKQNGNVPDILTFQAHFPKFQLAEVNESDDYLLDKLHEEYGYEKFRKIMPELDNKLKEDSRLAYDYLRAQMEYLKPRAVCNGKDIIKEARERLDAYLKRGSTEVPLTISTGFKEQDEILGGWEMGEELVTIVARTNQGKCMSQGTLIRMGDGTFKKVEDIKVGDKVQSYNMINTVLATHSGRSKGYKITPVKAGKEFIVTDNHILTLWHRNQIWDKSKGRKVTDGTGTLIDITIEEFLSKSARFQHDCFLYRAPVDYPEKELLISPYILGIWLGDGTSDCVELTNPDKVVIQEWYKFAEEANLGVSIRTRETTDCCSYRISNGIGGQTNPLLNKFRELNLIHNKHIPLDYLTSSREQRLELLAGLLDTDGYYDRFNNVYEIVSKFEILADNIVQLLRDLGFKAAKHIKRVRNLATPYYKVTFSGDLELIPCKLKKATNLPTIRREPCISRFKIERIEEEFEYYGFECDGDHRFLLEDNTLTHNSWILMKYLAEAWKQGKRVGLYSGEMSHLKLGYRFDALFEHLSNRALVRGYPVPNYVDYISNLEQMPNPFIIITQNELGGRPTVQHLRRFIEENQLDILGVDQLSLMEDGRASRNDPPRMRLSHIAEDLFQLSTEYKIPILALAQANRAGINKDDSMEAPGLENIKESDDIAHNSSKCIGIRQSPAGLVIDIIKNREGRVGDKLLYNWDIDLGEFTYMATPGDAATDTTRNAVAQRTKEAFAEATHNNCVF